MYTYLLIAIVILFTLFKYDIKESLKVQVTPSDSIILSPKKTTDVTVVEPNWSQYVLKSSIATCPTDEVGALQFSSDTDFKSIEDCYSKNKPPGASLKWRDFVKCINKKHPEANLGKINVPISGGDITSPVTNNNKKDLNFLEKLLNKIFD